MCDMLPKYGNTPQHCFNLLKVLVNEKHLSIIILKELHT